MQIVIPLFFLFFYGRSKDPVSHTITGAFVGALEKSCLTALKNPHSCEYEPISVPYPSSLAQPFKRQKEQSVNPQKMK